MRKTEIRLNGEKMVRARDVRASNTSDTNIRMTHPRDLKLCRGMGQGAARFVRLLVAMRFDIAVLSLLALLLLGVAR